MAVKPVQLLMLLGLLCLGCAQQTADSTDTATSETSSSDSHTQSESGSTAADLVAPDASATSGGSMVNGTLALSAENTQIQFVGTHTGDEPKPRTGVFTEFSGTAEIDPESQSLKSASVEIQIDSLVTQFEKLTNHLKSPDFFDSREHPMARFETTSVTPKSGSDEQIVTGNFTLMGTTKELSFPAKVQVADGALKLNGKFTFNRSEYGMDKMLEGVHDPVEVTVTIGEPTKVPEASEGP